MTNPLALRHLRGVRRQDRLLIYHTGRVRAVVGLALSASDPYPDPAKKDPKFVVIDVVPRGALPTPVTLDTMKADQRFQDFDLVRLPRLSVMPVPERLWRAIMTMAECAA